MVPVHYMVQCLKTFYIAAFLKVFVVESLGERKELMKGRGEENG